MRLREFTYDMSSTNEGQTNGPLVSSTCDVRWHWFARGSVQTPWIVHTVPVLYVVPVQHCGNQYSVRRQAREYFQKRNSKNAPKKRCAPPLHLESSLLLLFSTQDGAAAPKEHNRQSCCIMQWDPMSKCDMLE